MRAVIQRVSRASVKTESGHSDSIGIGLLVLLGIESDDTTEDINWLCGKISRLRIFNDENMAMNLSLQDVGGEVMVISQFTLFASTKKVTAHHLSELELLIFQLCFMNHF